MSNMRFLGKAAIVTGSNSGIGRGTALLMAKEGASVLIHGRNLSTIKETVAECERVAVDNAKFPYIQGDIINDDVLKKIHDTAVEKFGKIDILVNNAGYFETNPNLGSGSIGLFDDTVKVMLRSPLLLSQMCLPELKETKGNIVNTSSNFGVLPSDEGPFYCIAKVGLNMFTQCAALEFGDQGVRVNAICPGMFKETRIFKNQGVSQKEEFYSMTAKGTPLSKIGNVDDAAKLIAFLASEDASMMNGAGVVCDGGMVLTGLRKKTLENTAK